MATALSHSDLERALADLPDWAVVDGRLERTFAMPTYAEGVAFAVRVALLAEKTDHHPDALEIGWKRVRVAYVTHSAGGISSLDFQAARAVAGL